MTQKADLLDELRIDRTVRSKPRRRSTLWWWGPLTAALIATAAAGGWWLTRVNATVAVKVVSARAVSADSGPGAILDGSGYVVARRQATVSAKIPGKVEEVRVEEGMRVEANEIIARLDDSNYLASLNQVRAQLAQAEIALADAKPIYARAQAQLADGLVSRESFDAAKASYDQAQTNVTVLRAGLAAAQQAEDDTVVHAPFAGVVTVKAAQPGEIVSPLSAGSGFTRTGIATIVDMDSLEVEVDVSEDFINRVRPEQACRITLNAYPDWQIQGYVIAIIPTADRSKATVKVRIGFRQKDQRVLPEMGVRVAFLTDAPADHVAPTARVVVPAEAVLTGTGGADQAAVFVVHDDRVERRAVRLGVKVTAGQEILSGLSGGERIVAGDLDKLADGTRVKVQE
jgi:RND family efflux transporter MFP subunit